jgi:hypothetical protein
MGSLSRVRPIVTNTLQLSADRVQTLRRYWPPTSKNADVI